MSEQFIYAGRFPTMPTTAPAICASRKRLQIMYSRRVGYHFQNGLHIPKRLLQHTLESLQKWAFPSIVRFFSSNPAMRYMASGISAAGEIVRKGKKPPRRRASRMGNPRKTARARSQPSRIRTRKIRQTREIRQRLSRGKLRPSAHDGRERGRRLSAAARLRRGAI